MILQKFSLDKFINAIEEGFILVDFDARTGHNHGTKFRLRQDKMPELYEEVKKIGWDNKSLQRGLKVARK